jgi:hypothetical protein
LVKNLQTLLLFILCGALGYNIYVQMQKVTPCVDPIPYAIGDFSTKFNVSEEYFLKALKEAEDIWEVPYGKDLFVYDTLYKRSDLLKVNLIYDYRQEATSKLKTLGGFVDDNQATYDSMEAKFRVLKAEYTKDVAALNARITTFNKKTKEYEELVSYWNKKGGAPKKEYEELEATQLSLEQEAQALEAEQDRLEAVVKEINVQVVLLNRLADKLNINVRDYNNTNAGRGESFQEALYVSEGGEYHIDIYEFSNRKKLVRVLAHELGHALGLDHVPGESSIMYEFNSGENMTLSDEDLGALRAVCGQ